MDIEEAKREIKPRLREYVESVTARSKGRDKYICPLCGSGTGKGRTGAFSIQTGGERWKCFACGESGDIFDLIGHIYTESNAGAQIGIACGLFGIELEVGQKQAKIRQGASKPAKQITSASAYAYTHTHTEEEQEQDLSAFFLEAHSNIGKTDYPGKRGISQEMIDRFQLGYIAAWRHPKAPAQAEATPRLIIPTGAGSYVARDTRDNVPEAQEDYKKQKVGQARLLNVEALKGATRPIFIVEGELDAISIVQVGGEAVALGSISMVRSFLDAVARLRPRCPFIIALDNEADKPQVNKATEALEAGLERAGLASYRYNPCGRYKDANEALQADSAGLRAAVRAIASEVEDFSKAEEAARLERHLQTSALYLLDAFIDGIAESAQTRAIPTGFWRLDKALDGGLYEGLYILGAISSLGKTTLAMQIADQIAASGQDVLIFSLEMPRAELIAKSISRQTIELTRKQGIDSKNAKTARGITSGARYENYSNEEKELIESAIQEYKRYADHLYIHEGIGTIGVEQVRAVVAEHVRITGNRPVIVVDYLQILSPYNERATDKQNTDKAVLELKRISRDFKIPVIGISSFNRANYKEAVTMEAFKESGAIEYSSDVLIGLQLEGAGKKDFDVNAAKSANPRKVEAIILKNRNGKTGSKLAYSFYAMFNYFKEEP